MGYSMLTDVDGHFLRYTEWVHYPGPSNAWQPVWSTSYGIELYNHTADAAENANVFDAVRGGAVARTLHDRLRKGWAGNFARRG